MIIAPSFPEHWKTRLLIELTSDESAPMAVIRLWCHCQNSRRDKFPDMTPAQLASICRWGDRKPACHVALIKAGFVDKLTPKGFAAHQWSEHNAQLLQKWQAGQKGGRTPASENPNETADSGKPTDNRPVTARVPDKSRVDQTRPDQIDKSRPVQTERTDAPVSLSPAVLLQQLRDAANGGGKDGDCNALVLGGGKDGGKDGVAAIDGVASLIAQKLTAKCGAPTIHQVRSYLASCFNGAVNYAEPFFAAMEKQHWQDKNRKPIADWRSMAKAYASKAHLKR